MPSVYMQLDARASLFYNVLALTLSQPTKLDLKQLVHDLLANTAGALAATQTVLPALDRAALIFLIA